jgi:hypothetical protein
LGFERGRSTPKKTSCPVLILLVPKQSCFRPSLANMKSLQLAAARASQLERIIRYERSGPAKTLNMSRVPSNEAKAQYQDFGFCEPPYRGSNTPTTTEVSITDTEAKVQALSMPRTGQLCSMHPSGQGAKTTPKKLLEPDQGPKNHASSCNLASPSELPITPPLTPSPSIKYAQSIMPCVTTPLLALS